jgi:hypothetical protein
MEGEKSMTSYKMIIITVALFMTGLVSANAQTNAAPAKNQNYVGLSSKKVGTYISKSHIDCPNHLLTCQTIAIEPTVVNMSKTNLSIKVEWFFVAKRSDSAAKVLFGSGDKTLELKSGATTSFKVSSDTLYLHDPSCVEMNPKTDAKMFGYVVRALVDGECIQFTTTQPSLKEIVSSDASFQKMKKDSAEWEKTRPTNLSSAAKTQP